MLKLAIPAAQALARDVPRLRCELIEAEPEESLPALALGDIDLALGDEWQRRSRRLPEGTERHDLFDDPVDVVLPARHPLARRFKRTVPLASLAGETWASGHPGMGWEEMTYSTCRELGGFEPDIRHRANDANVTLEVVSRGLGVALLPDFALPPRMPGIVRRSIAEGKASRAIFAVTRTVDAARPSTQALLSAVRAAVPYQGVSSSSRPTRCRRS
jgi:DNA-binding transcriptional LysR family regulator